MSSTMGGRGRRQVLQLDDVSSSYPAKNQGFSHHQDSRKQAANPLLSLVSHYNSDSSASEAEDEDSTMHQPKDHPPEERNSQLPDEAIPFPKETIPLPKETIPLPKEAIPLPKEAIPLPKEAIPLPKETIPLLKEAIPLPKEAIPLPKEAIPLPKERESDRKEVVVGSLSKSLRRIPLPSTGEPSAGDAPGKSIDHEVASFLAEIESISAEPNSEDKTENSDDLTTADSSQPAEPDFGFIPKADATFLKADAVDASSTKDNKEDRLKPASSSSAYKSMFVKGAAEFVGSSQDEEKKTNGKEPEEELPEEPLSDWQLVQDESTQYYYYWNTVTNEVTWEIPPDYTQFLLRYKEYEERLAAIPKEKLQRLKESRDKKKIPGSSVNPEASPNPPPVSEHRHRKSKKDKHRKDKSQPGSSEMAAEIGPQLPPPGPEARQSETKLNLADKEDSLPLDNKKPDLLLADSAIDMFLDGAKTFLSSDSAVDSTSTTVSADVEAIFDEALSAIAESSADSTKPTVSVNSSSEIPSSMPSADSSRSVDVAESLRATSCADTAAVNSAVVASCDVSSGSGTGSVAVVSSSSLASKLDVTENSVEDAVTNSGVNDDTLPDEDDLDMDFDDIDDLDRALEKALEKKLEKRKAELEKLERLKPEDSSLPDSLASSSSPTTTPTPTSPDLRVSKHSKKRSKASRSPSDKESDVSSSVKITSHSKSEGKSSRKHSSKSHKDRPEASDSDTKSSSKHSKKKDKEERRSSSKHKKSKSKRSSVESSSKEPAKETAEPSEKKARLVAYDDAGETDEEGKDVSEEVSTTPAKASSSPPGLDKAVDVLPTPPPERVDNLAEIQEMADTAFAKLNFLDVTSDGLSPLQTSLVQLQTRFIDWKEGGLNGEYFYQRMTEVNTLLKQYERSAVPQGWSCQWDSNFRRYFYINASTGQPQWDYPEASAVDSSTGHKRKSHKGKDSKRKKAKVMGPEPRPAGDAEAAAAGGEEEALPRRPTDSGDQDGASLREEAVDSSETSKTEVPQTSTNSHELPPSPSAPTENGLASDSVAPVPSMFPGEPLPPGTELLLGLPPPPPPPPPEAEAEAPSTSQDLYVCDEESSDDGKHEGQDPPTEGPLIDPDIDGVEMMEEEGEEGRRKEEEEVVEDDPAVISRPPQLRFPPAAVAAALASAAEAHSHVGFEASSSSTLSAPPVLVVSAQHLPDSASITVTAAPTALAASHAARHPASPTREERVGSRMSPGPSREAASSSHHDHSKHSKHDKHEKHSKDDKHKKKKKDKSMALKKKGVDSLFKKWTSVAREVEEEERAKEKRQEAIRQQLEEWKKENS